MNNSDHVFELISGENFECEFTDNGQKVSMTWKLSPSLFQDLRQVLSQMTEQEVKITHKGEKTNWNFYFHVRPGQTRMMVARPQVGEYSVTIFLEKLIVPQFIEELSSSDPAEIHISQLGMSHPLNNFSLLIARK